jgi:hypothetical protein
MIGYLWALKSKVRCALRPIVESEISRVCPLLVTVSLFPNYLFILLKYRKP